MSKAAIVVGIDKYDQAPLSGCRNDAEGIQAILEMPEYGYDVVSLLDETANRGGILGLLRTITAEQPEQLLFFFAGHGASTDFGTYLVTYDAKEDDPGIELSHLGRIMEGVSKSVPQVVVILDCCHAGAARPWVTCPPLTTEQVERSISTAHEARVVLAACRPDQLAAETIGGDGVCHGSFTSCLLDGFSGDARDFDGQVTVNGLWEFASKEFKFPVDQQALTFRGDYTGSIILGEGLPPREGPPIPMERRDHLTGRARGLMEDYETIHSPRDTAACDWVTGGYADACVALQPVVLWVDETLREYPEISQHASFRSVVDRVNNARSHLGGLTLGLRTPLGDVVDRLGAGGFGTVWRADDHGTERAIKIYHPEELGEKSKKRIFHQGFEAMERLDHPRIVKVFEYREVPLAFSMQYIQAPNLRDFGMLRTLGEVALVRILAEVTDAVSYAHARGVVHRDIKPENILLEYDATATSMTPYLTDFDLAWFNTAKTVTRAMGSVFYAAPEQLAKPRSEAAKRATVDLFSLGQLFFFSITASDPVPLNQADNQRLLSKCLNKWSNSTAASEMSQLILQCTAYEPEDRPQSALTVLAKLHRIRMLLEGVGSRRMTPREFAKEVAFRYRGLPAEPDMDADDEVNFASLTSRTRVRCTCKRHGGRGGAYEIEYQLSADELRLNEMSSGQSARANLNARLDATLKGVSGVSVFPGHKGRYQVFVKVFADDLDEAEVARCHDVLQRSIETIESV